MVIVSPITSHQCVQCDQFKASRHLDVVQIGADTYYVCETCSDLSGPGKYQAVDESDWALCVVLEWLAGVSSMDHWLSDESGYAGVSDRYMLIEDDRGFVEVREFTSVDAAMREMNSFEDDGFGASDMDAYISCDRNGYGVSFDGKFVGTYGTERRARAKVSLLMRETGYYPNVYLTGEHGPTIRRIEVW